MTLPTNISKEHLLQAIEKIDKEGIPKDGASQYYDVLYNGGRYPPKVIISYANLFANNEILERDSFRGGLNTESFKLLEANGFEIAQKENNNGPSYFEEINTFLIQAKNPNLKTSHYQKIYSDLKVSVSFGKGNFSKIPWISFLGKNQTTQDGIYPVYLMYSGINKLVLAYGISETKKPELKWNVNELTLKEYFKSNNLGDPNPYPNSFVYQVYDTSQNLDEKMINQDLNDLLEIYKKTLENQTIDQPIKPKTLSTKFNYKLFRAHAVSSNLYLSQNLDVRFIASLLTKPFVILTGLSGSGKTKLAQAFAMWICENENQYCIVPVGADWTNREPLLGFPNVLKNGEYVKPDNGVLNLLIESATNPDKPYFLILDEMNLSHVERYFADFLSVMESQKEISLHAGIEHWSNVPSKIKLPYNLFIIGTVNIDETTYMFSPKVLDRASVIEFRVTEEEMKSYLSNNKPLHLESMKAAGASMADDFVAIAKDRTIELENSGELTKVLMDFFSELKKTGAEFGFRSASEILRFAVVVNKTEGTNWTLPQIIDAAIMQKLLPKVHGSRRKLEPVLKTLATLCLQDGHNIDDFINAKTEINFSDGSKIKYPLSLEKILRMNQSLTSNGFTSYAEA